MRRRVRREFMKSAEIPHSARLVVIESLNEDDAISLVDL